MTAPASPSGHGGDLARLARAAGRDPDAILDCSANINPLGPPPWLRPAIDRHITRLAHYPDPRAEGLCDAAARHFGVAPDHVCAGNGSVELMYVLAASACAPRALIPAPAYSDYARACEAGGIPVQHSPLPAENDFVLDPDVLGAQIQPGDLVFLGQPVNPTGRTLSVAALRSLIETHPDAIFVIDEAFADLCDGEVSLLPEVPDNAVILRSLTKCYAIPGLRLGLAFGAPERLRPLRLRLPPWSVNTLAQAVGIRALEDTEYLVRSRDAIRAGRAMLMDELNALPNLRVVSGEANYLLLQLTTPDWTARALAEKLLVNDGIAVRVCDNFVGLDETYLRIAVRIEEENRRLLTGLARLLAPHRAPVTTPQRRARPLMIQGTCSNAGKSVLAAALCRILLQEGYRVAPFKAQNMALNSFVTLDGGEMGRAQVVQAQACRLEPEVRMNPVLLKPSSETGSQVIVNGRPVGTMRVTEYVRYKPTAFSAVQEAYDSLAQEYDAIVLEGAGSPGEVNLKAHDIVNMRMAAYANAPVLLAGDIDRGGVYASFVGTLAVLEEWERRLVAGFVVNKFRGDPSLLADAHAYVQDATGKPVLGVVPWLPDLGLPEEDSVSFKQAVARTNDASEEAAVTVVLVDLPFISNFTDFDPFRGEPDVHFRIARAPEDLADADAVLIPGSKNVIGDLAHLRASGLAEALLQHVQRGGVLVGVCGGLQMLGHAIADPHGLESTTRACDGLGLLPVRTALAADKTLTRVTGVHTPSGCTVTGYEIHHGVTDPATDALPVMQRDDGVAIGYGATDGTVWGSYLHGLFDDDRFRRWFLNDLRARKGLPPLAGEGASYDLDAALDRLAAHVRSHIDLAAILRIMGLA